mmetsp:Transcript_34711/g.84953  ORF Transcript_34711/g.84953 Transcript_34711/m.84953 type:complete len:269 (+) Transcript_34711:144-950(+)
MQLLLLQRANAHFALGINNTTEGWVRTNTSRVHRRRREVEQAVAFTTSSIGNTPHTARLLRTLPTLVQQRALRAGGGDGGAVGSLSRRRKGSTSCNTISRKFSRSANLETRRRAPTTSRAKRSALIASRSTLALRYRLRIARAVRRTRAGSISITKITLTLLIVSVASHATTDGKGGVVANHNKAHLIFRFITTAQHSAFSKVHSLVHAVRSQSITSVDLKINRFELLGVVVKHFIFLEDTLTRFGQPPLAHSTMAVTGKREHSQFRN